MVKVCEEQYPIGSFPGQKTAGFYMDKTLKENLDILAEKVTNDMDFIIVVSGKGAVRSGKSAFVQQLGTYLTYKINEKHKTKNKFTNDNIVFRGNELIKVGLRLPKYNVIVLDEGDDLTSAHFSKDAVRLRRFFRKCGQLNHIIILIIPDFFELPRNYAVTRTVCLINVYFFKKFERGYFEFYSHKRKKKLYVKGKRWGDYDVINANFKGRFPKLYTVDEKEYKEKKFRDLYEEEEKEIKNVRVITKECWITVLKNINKIKPKLTQKQKAQLFNMSQRNIGKYTNEIKKEALGN